jgi:hypothetical protein
MKTQKEIIEELNYLNNLIYTSRRFGHFERDKRKIKGKLLEIERTPYASLNEDDEVIILNLQSLIIDNF